MRANTLTKRRNLTPQLVCPDCGNMRRFIEVMAEEAHLVDGNFNYIHLVQAIVDHYVCCECGGSFPVPDKMKPVESSAGDRTSA